ncbi:MAG TPA: ribosome maturation factor RimM [Caulobacteraceae bacterium]|jgi:16S rRNA processing protein RimM|nr:ribosome maturation factor RimM [Caulobacteraceae bacterium]
MTAPALILVGQVGGAFGVRGEVRITTFTEDPAALVDYRDLRREDGSPALTLVSGRPAKKGLVARAEEIATPEQADALRGLKLYVPRAILPEPDEDEFYLADLIGLEARDPDGAVLGRIKTVHDFGAGDLLEITPATPGATWWVAFTRETCPEIRLGDGVIIVVRPAETSDQAEAGGET